ncbi:MAG: cupin domain-containing protein [Planctomycetes bacterium]|nr:cupin domain-containing protein [Planctomycetota bacterium]
MQPTRIDTEAIRADWARRGFSCEVWIDPPSQVWRDFQYEVDAMVLLLEGECLIETPGRTVRLQAGDELLIPAGARHTVRNCGQGPARWLHGFREPPAAFA